MLVVAHVLIAIARRNASFSHDDDAGRASVNAESTSCADVFVDDKNYVIVGVGAGGHDVGRIFNGSRRKHMDAFPRADIDASFAHDAFGLINMQELLRFDALVQVVDRDLRQCVAPREIRQWRVRFGFGHRRSIPS